jgi:transposase
MSKKKSQSTNWKERRRIQALKLKRNGWKQKDIASALNVSKGAVSQWLKLASEEGKKSLCAHPHTGRIPKLTSIEKQYIPDLLSYGAEAYGFRGEVWTCLRVRKVIEWKFGVSYNKSHVARLLKDLKWTPQMPMERATQRDESAITHWRSEVWVEMKKKAHLEHRILIFVDESGFYLLPATVRTYAPCGHTPILRAFLTHDHLSVMSGITPQGWLFTMTRDDSMNGLDSVHFLKHLLWQTNSNLLVIWDGSPIHRNQCVKDYLANGATKHIHLERLPAYAPDLNPDEGVWDHLKYVELRNMCCSDLNHLHRELNLAILRLRHKPDLIQSFFALAGLSI